MGLGQVATGISIFTELFLEKYPTEGRPLRIPGSHTCVMQFARWQLSSETDELGLFGTACKWSYKHREITFVSCVRSLQQPENRHNVPVIPTRQCWRQSTTSGWATPLRACNTSFFQSFSPNKYSTHLRRDLLGSLFIIIVITTTSCLPVFDAKFWTAHKWIKRAPHTRTLQFEFLLCSLCQ